MTSPLSSTSIIQNPAYTALTFSEIPIQEKLWEKRVWNNSSINLSAQEYFKMLIGTEYVEETATVLEAWICETIDFAKNLTPITSRLEIIEHFKSLGNFHTFFNDKKNSLILLIFCHHVARQSYLDGNIPKYAEETFVGLLNEIQADNPEDFKKITTEDFSLKLDFPQEQKQLEVPIQKIINEAEKIININSKVLKDTTITSNERECEGAHKIKQAKWKVKKITSLEVFRIAFLTLGGLVMLAGDITSCSNIIRATWNLLDVSKQPIVTVTPAIDVYGKIHALCSMPEKFDMVSETLLKNDLWSKFDDLSPSCLNTTKSSLHGYFCNSENLNPLTIIKKAKECYDEELGQTLLTEIDGPSNKQYHAIKYVEKLADLELKPIEDSDLVSLRLSTVRATKFTQKQIERLSEEFGHWFIRLLSDKQIIDFIKDCDITSLTMKTHLSLTLLNERLRLISDEKIHELLMSSKDLYGIYLKDISDSQLTYHLNHVSTDFLVEEWQTLFSGPSWQDNQKRMQLISITKLLEWSRKYSHLSKNTLRVLSNEQCRAYIQSLNIEDLSEAGYLEIFGPAQDKNDHRVFDYLTVTQAIKLLNKFSHVKEERLPLIPKLFGRSDKDKILTQWLNSLNPRSEESIKN